MKSTKKEREDEYKEKSILTKESLLSTEGLLPNLHLQTVLTGEIKWHFSLPPLTLSLRSQRCLIWYSFESSLPPSEISGDILSCNTAKI